MAAAEVLTIARGIDDKVKVVDERVQSVDMKVEGIQDHVQIVDSKVEGVDDRVKDVSRNVGSVIQGESYFRSLIPWIGPQSFSPLGVMENGVAIRQVLDQATDQNRS